MWWDQKIVKFIDWQEIFVSAAVLHYHQPGYHVGQFLGVVFCAFASVVSKEWDVWYATLAESRQHTKVGLVCGCPRRFAVGACAVDIETVYALIKLDQVFGH